MNHGRENKTIPGLLIHNSQAWIIGYKVLVLINANQALTNKFYSTYAVLLDP